MLHQRQGCQCAPQFQYGGMLVGHSHRAWNDGHHRDCVVLFALFGDQFDLLRVHNLYYVFRCRYLVNDANAKISGRPIALFLTYELMMIMCYSFMDSRVYDYLMIAIMLGGSYLVFLRVYLENPFYNRAIGKLWSIMVALNLWTVLLLTFSKFLEVSECVYNNLGYIVLWDDICVDGWDGADCRIGVEE